MATPMLDTVTLANETVWSNEFDYTGIQMSKQFTVGGKLVLQSGTKQGGRSFEIKTGWINLTTLRLLETLRDTSGWSGTLQLVDGRTYTVMFDNSSSVPLEVTNVIGDQQNLSERDIEKFEIVLRLIETA